MGGVPVAQAVVRYVVASVVSTKSLGRRTYGKAKMRRFSVFGGALAALASLCLVGLGTAQVSGRWHWAVGDERAIREHLQPAAHAHMEARELIEAGKRLFTARWTIQDGQGRPLTKGTGVPLTDQSSPLVFPRNFNRISGPDTGACSMCHNTPLVGGGGDFAMNVSVGGERFDFVTFDPTDTMPLRGTLDEHGKPTTMQSVANTRKVVGMFGSGFIEMLSRQMTVDLQRIARDCAIGATCELTTKGVSFGRIHHTLEDTWDTHEVVGLTPKSVQTQGTTPPSLILRTLHQSGMVVSLRQFTNEAFNQHHGIQSREMFPGDPDGDGVEAELTETDVTAVTLFQATLPVPGRVVPRHPAVRSAIRRGERLFEDVGCGTCHVPALSLEDRGWLYSEPGPFNPEGNLQLTPDGPLAHVDLTSSDLPLPRLEKRRGVVRVPAYTDLKLHDITTGRPSCASHPNLVATDGCDGDVEALDLGVSATDPRFSTGNGRFITRKLWGIANQHGFGHHGQYTTLREAVLAHYGEANSQRLAFEALTDDDRNAVIEFLKSLQILKPGTPCQVVDEDYQCTNYRPRYLEGGNY